ncbi:MAG TPA: 50S ribosomal protein L13 [Candidatus Binatia bacterium]|nr:50S ribosomal protein L13 [Candidatus Binatia bacterium]
MATITLDATNTIVGRLCSHAAKHALRGDSVNIVNVEKAIMTGSRAFIFGKYTHARVERGQIRHGPYLHRRPDMFVRRIVRGMLPFEKARGKEAFGRVMCYKGVPPDLKDAKAETLGPKTQVAKLINVKYVTIADLCKHLGAK